MKPERSKFLVPDEFRRLLAGARGSGAQGMRQRNYMLLCLAGNLGLRVSETVALRLGDFRLAGPHPFVRVATRKQGAPQDNDLALDDKLLGLVRRYVSTLSREAKRRFQVQDAELLRRRQALALFPGTTPWAPVSSRQAQLIFKRAARTAGLDPLLSFHALRHYRGMQVYQATKNLVAVKQFLRHRSLASTYAYQHLDPEEQARINARVSSII